MLFKPYTHIEIALDVRRDLLDDGQLTIAGGNYAVNPRIAEAIKQYPSFYYGGAVAGDGFPDIVYGQSIIHPDSAGVWIGHVFDKAWAAQLDTSPYSPGERLQILAWSYGFSTHAAGDIWAHTLVNEFTDGTFPTFANVVTEADAAANAIRHFIVEAYVGDATPGFDGVKEVNCDGDPEPGECTDEVSQPHGFVPNEDIERVRLPDGDVSDDATTLRDMDAPHQFIFDALIRDLPDLPGHKEQFLFTVSNAGPLYGQLDAGQIPAVITAAFDTEGIVLPSFLGTAPAVQIAQAGQTWQIHSDYADYTLRSATQNSGVPLINVFENVKSRGVAMDQFFTLRQQLVDLQAELLDLNPNLPPAVPIEPLELEVNLALEELQRLLKGDNAFDMERLYDRLKDIGEQFIPVIDVFDAAFSDTDITQVDLQRLADFAGATVNDYLTYWIGNIDRGLAHWSELGLATSRALFDPQSKRDLQNRSSWSAGPDAVDPDFNDKRAEEEDEVGIFDRLEDEVNDPNDDGRIDDSFVNQYLLPMIGVPRKVGELASGAFDGLAVLKEKLLDPASALLGDLDPFDPLFDWIKEEVKEIAKEILAFIVKDAFGIDIYAVEFLLTGSLGTKLDIKSFEIATPDETIVVPLFKPADHEKLDSYLGIGAPDYAHLKPYPCLSPDDAASCGQLNQTVVISEGDADGPQDDTTVSVLFQEDARGELKENVEFDKQKFAAYANSVNLSKLLLLQETLVNETPLNGQQPKTISKLLTDLTKQNPNDFYDFALMNLNGNHGGSIMTATMPAARDSLGELTSNVANSGQPIWDDAWLSSIDASHQWRETARTRESDMYRFHETGVGNNQVEWNVTGLPAGSYHVQVDWLVNNHVTAEGTESPATEAVYRIDNGQQIVSRMANQSVFPGYTLTPGDTVDLEASRLSWEHLGTFTVNGGTLRVLLNDDADGEFVVAGRVRLVPVNNPAAEIIITNAGSTVVGFAGTPPVGTYQETTGLVPTSNPTAIFSWNATPALAAAGTNDLNGAGTPGSSFVPQGLLNTFAANDIASSYFTEKDFGLGLIVSLLDVSNPVSQIVLLNIADDLETAMQDAVDAFEEGELDALNFVQGVLANALNSLLRGPSIYNAGAFADVILLQETGNLLTQGPIAGERLIRLNRLLLEDAYPEEIVRSLPAGLQPDLGQPRGFVVTPITAGSAWKLTRVQLADAQASGKVAVAEEYVVARNGNSFDVYSDWKGIQYRAGAGNFPLWESATLRDKAFRVLFKDWQNGAENFPALGDSTTADPNVNTPAITFGAYPAYVPFAPTLIAPAAGNIVVSGNQVLTFPGGQTFTSITGDGDAIPDSLTLIIGGRMTLAANGFIGGRGLTNITIEAQEGITLLENATISSRQVAAGANHWNAPSTAPSGNIMLIAPVNSEGVAGDIQIGKGANVLAHSTAPHAAGNVTLSVTRDFNQAWSFLTIENFKWIESQASIEVAMDARLTGNDIRLETSATTKKEAVLNRNFSVATRALAMGDLDGDDLADLIVGTEKQGILRYEYVGGHFESPTAIDNGLFSTTSVALGDVDGDSDLDLVVGNNDQPNRLYLNDNGTLTFAANIDVARKTTALALANLDADPELELITATDGEGIRLYQFANGSFGAPTTIDSAAFATKSIAVGDVDADSDLDLVVGNFSQAARLYINSGGSLGAGTNIGDSTRKTTAVALANIDADANAELAIATDGEGIRVYQFAAGSFAAPTTIDTAALPATSLAFADIDGDSRADLIAGFDGRRNRIYRNAAGSLGAGQDIAGAARYTTSLIVGNIDGEPGLDLVVGNDRQPNRVYRWLELLGTTASQSGYVFGEDIDVDNQLVDSAQLVEPVGISTDARPLRLSSSRRRGSSSVQVVCYELRTT